MESSGVSEAATRLGRGYGEGQAGQGIVSRFVITFCREADTFRLVLGGAAIRLVVVVRSRAYGVRYPQPRIRAARKILYVARGFALFVTLFRGDFGALGERELADRDLWRVLHEHAR